MDARALSESGVWIPIRSQGRILSLAENVRCRLNIESFPRHRATEIKKRVVMSPKISAKIAAIIK